MSAELDAKWCELVKIGKAWWVPGMLTADGYLVTVADPSGVAGVQADDWWPKAWGLEQWGGLEAWAPVKILPEWDDPATLGALVGQVEARYGAPVSVSYFGERRRCTVRFSADRYWDGATKAAALLDALEAAP